MVAAALVLGVTLGLWLRGRPAEPPTAGGPANRGASAAPAAAPQQASAPPPAVQNQPEQAASPVASGAVPQPPQTNAGNAGTSASGIDPAAVQAALAQLTQRGGQTNASAAPTAASPVGSDRYPGSQAVNVENAGLPNIGIPVATEVYTTTDSVSTVVNYYKQRYPEAEVTEINGQQIIAINRPGGSKVIAIGSTGQETRIAIVQPGG